MKLFNPVESSFNRFKGGGKVADLPPIAAPVPTPEDIDLQSTEKGDAERRRLQARKGRRSTILTEASLETQPKKTLLGD
jgi:hypothetical protein